MSELRSKTISGLKWTYVSNFLVRGIQPVVVAILARILAPEDFGLMAMALAVSGFVSLFRDAGLGQALIQHRGETEGLVDRAFWLMFLLGGVWFGLTWVCAPIVAEFYHRKEIVSILRVLGTLFLVYPFSDIVLNLLLRQLEFKALLFRQLFPLLLSGAVSIGLACAGYGVWSLVWGTVVGAVGTSVVVCALTGWMPRWRPGSGSLAGPVRFGLHVSLQRILGWLTASVDQVLVGKFLGAASLGVYRMAWTYGEIPWTMVTGPFNVVAYPIFCKASQDRSEVRRLYLSFLRWLSLIGVPIGVSAALLAPYLVPLVLGEKWVEAMPIIQLIAIVGINSSIVCVNPEAYKAIGRADVASKFLLARALASLPVYYYASHRGIVTLAVSHVLLVCIFGPVNMYVSMRLLGISLKELLGSMRGGILVGLSLALAGALYYWAARQIGTSLYVATAGMLLVVLLTSCAAFYAFDRTAFRQAVAALLTRGAAEGP